MSKRLVIDGPRVVEPPPGLNVVAMRWPSGSPIGCRKRRAKVSLTTSTGSALAVSADVNARPLTSGTPNVEKYPGVTARMPGDRRTFSWSAVMKMGCHCQFEDRKAVEPGDGGRPGR